MRLEPYPGGGTIIGLSLSDSQFGEEETREALQEILKLLTAGKLCVCYLVRTVDKPTTLNLVPIPTGWRAMLHVRAYRFRTIRRGGTFSFKVSSPEPGGGGSIRLALGKLTVDKKQANTK